MGVMGLIAQAKGKFHQRRMDVLQNRTDKIRQENIREAEITEAKRALREAQQIKEDFKRDQRMTIEKAPPSATRSNIQKLGRGLAAHMKKQKAQGKGNQFGGGSTGLQFGGSGSPFGGTRPLDVGGRGIQFGREEPPKKVERQKSITIKI